MDRIERIVERLAKNSFVIKGWAVTLSTGVIAYGYKVGGSDFAGLAALPALIFWALDAYYLSLERAFRELYVSAVARKVPLHCLDPSHARDEEGEELAKQRRKRISFLRALLAGAVWPIYGGILVTVAVMLYLPGRNAPAAKRSPSGDVTHEVRTEVGPSNATEAGGP